MVLSEINLGTPKIDKQASAHAVIMLAGDSHHGPTHVIICMVAMLHASNHTAEGSSRYLTTTSKKIQQF